MRQGNQPSYRKLLAGATCLAAADVAIVDSDTRTTQSADSLQQQSQFAWGCGCIPKMCVCVCVACVTTEAGLMCNKMREISVVGE